MKKKARAISASPGQSRRAVLIYFLGEELDTAAELSTVLPVFFCAFFARFLWVFVFAVVLCVSVDACAWFCAFLAAGGAAIRKGTATTVSRVDVNSFFIWFLLQLVADL
jgi:hypothetical protein